MNTQKVSTSVGFSKLPTEIQTEILILLNHIPTIRIIHKAFPDLYKLIESMVCIISIQFGGLKPYESLVERRLTNDVVVLDYENIGSLGGGKVPVVKEEYVEPEEQFQFEFEIEENEARNELPQRREPEPPEPVRRRIQRRQYEEPIETPFEKDPTHDSIFTEIIPLKSTQKHYMIIEIHAYLDQTMNLGSKARARELTRNREMLRFLSPVRWIQQRMATTSSIYNEDEEEPVILEPPQNLHFDFFEDLDSFLLGRCGTDKDMECTYKDSFYSWQDDDNVKRCFLEKSQSLNMMLSFDFYDEKPKFDPQFKELGFSLRQHLDIDFESGSLTEPGCEEDKLCAFPSFSSCYGPWLSQRALEGINLDQIISNPDGLTDDWKNFDMKCNNKHSISSDLVLLLSPGRERLQKVLDKPRLQATKLEQSRDQLTKTRDYLSPTYLYRRPEKHHSNISTSEKLTVFESSLTSLGEFFQRNKSLAERFAIDNSFVNGNLQDISEAGTVDEKSLHESLKQSIEHILESRYKFESLTRKHQTAKELKQRQFSSHNLTKGQRATRVEPMIANNFLLASMLYGPEAQSYEGNVDYVRICFINDAFGLKDCLVKELREYCNMIHVVEEEMLWSTATNRK
ncbi:hypothetical protein WICPIJ_005348 [Wickerhamomyces pijperi]|uniref:Uncharacterized protein n=1 Tax=Wickerhamomyces pijperi TaxID=599730 RepID=A0A9P8Q6A8_WICPI|nr:hypothetical protein WICPIJ_005348 [Wickerhamomyces pijperi]